MLKLYKTFRNHLRPLAIDDSFFVIWSYVQNLQFNKNYPKNIEVNSLYGRADIIQKKRMCAEWNLEILAREILIHSEVSYPKKSLSKWNYLSNGINKLKAIEGEIAKKYIKKDNVIKEISVRIPNLQFEWNSKANQETLLRYYEIFSDEKLDKILKDKTGLTAKNFYFINLALTGAFLSSPAVNYPIYDIELEEMNAKDIENFLELFAIDINKLRNLLIEENEKNDKFLFPSSSMRDFPIIKMLYRGSNCLVCPLPTLLFWRASKGLYYQICREKGFGNAFGRSFENYIGKVIEKSNINKSFNAIAEIIYSKGQEKSSDWLIYDEESIIFVECKTKRLPISARFSLDNLSLENEIEKMAGNIVKVYKTISDYKNNKYEKFAFDKNKTIFPLIVTLEQWYFFGTIPEQLKKKVAKKLEEKNIPVECLSEMPYSICGSDEFETIMQIINQTKILPFMKKKVFDKEKYSHMFKAFIDNEFDNEMSKTKFLFEDNFEKLRPRKK